MCVINWDYLTRYDFDSGDTTKNSFTSLGGKKSDKSKPEAKGPIL